MLDINPGSLIAREGLRRLGADTPSTASHPSSLLPDPQHTVTNETHLPSSEPERPRDNRWQTYWVDPKFLPERIQAHSSWTELKLVQSVTSPSTGQNPIPASTGSEVRYISDNRATKVGTIQDGIIAAKNYNYAVGVLGFEAIVVAIAIGVSRGSWVWGVAAFIGFLFVLAMLYAFKPTAILATLAMGAMWAWVFGSIGTWFGSDAPLGLGIVGFLLSIGIHSSLFKPSH